MELINRQKEDLGLCLIHIYRQPGDLYESWDIVRANPDGSFSRAPDARYGVDQSEGEHRIEDFTPLHLVEVYSRYDDNGWTKSETEIKTIDGRLIASRGD